MKLWRFSAGALVRKAPGFTSVIYIDVCVILGIEGLEKFLDLKGLTLMFQAGLSSAASASEIPSKAKVEYVE